MIKHKTIHVIRLIRQTNEFNRTSADNLKEWREARNIFLEQILRDTYVYDGFYYLTKDQLSGDAMSVGTHGQDKTGTWIFDHTDHTRINYFIDDFLNK